MKIVFVFGGGRTTAEAADLLADYQKRIERTNDLEIILVKSKETDDRKIRDDESERIRNLISSQDYVILFDERGIEMSSIDYANILEEIKNSGAKRIVIIVGGAYGVNDDIRRLAQRTISFSKMIFPHELARVMALEQTYRAISIKLGSKYHHQ